MGAIACNSMSCKRFFILSKIYLLNCLHGIIYCITLRVYYLIKNLKK